MEEKIKTIINKLRKVKSLELLDYIIALVDATIEEYDC